MSEQQPGAVEARAAARVIESLCGVVIPEYRRPFLHAELHRLGGAGGAAAALDLLAAGETATREALVGALTIPETYLFRHPGHFELLHRVAVERARAGRPTRVLSAGCSTGEEAWSAAAVLASVPLTSGLRHRVDGWDLCAERVERAREACYGAWSLRGGLMDYEEHFLRDGSTIRPGPHLRSFVRFEQANLLEARVSGDGAFDVVFLRNVAIYWKPATVRAVWRRLAGLLDADGVFLVGPSDPVELPQETWRQRVEDGARFLRRRGRDATDRRRAASVAAPADLRDDRESTEPGDPPARPAPAPRVRRAPVPPAPPARPPVDAEAATDGSGVLNRVRLLADEGRYREALDILHDDGASGSVEGRSWCGVLHLALEDAAEAVRLFRQCVFLEPGEVSHRRWLAAAYESAGMAEEAAREMRNIEELSTS